MFNWRIAFYATLLIYSLLLIYEIRSLRGSLNAMGAGRLLSHLLLWAFALAAASFPVYWTVRGMTGYELPRIMHIVGGYAMPLVFYAFFIILIIKLLGFILSKHVIYTPPWLGLAAVLLVLSCVGVFGIYQEKNTVIKYYDYDFNSGKEGEEIIVVFISDIHAGANVGFNRLLDLTERVNALEPDIVILAGDIIDTYADKAREYKIDEALKKLSAPLGVFGTLGNHEMIHGMEESLRFLQDSGIVVLDDKATEPLPGLLLIGRNDMRTERFGIPQVPLSDITKNYSGDIKSKIKIVIDHSPYPSRFEEAVSEGVSLMLSGHTHNGQLFPFNFITRRMYPVSKGEIKKDGTALLVSSGYGTWGPAMRTTGRSEFIILNITLPLTEKSEQSEQKEYIEGIDEGCSQ